MGNGDGLIPRYIANMKVWADRKKLVVTQELAKSIRTVPSVQMVYSDDNGKYLHFQVDPIDDMLAVWVPDVGGTWVPVAIES